MPGEEQNQKTEVVKAEIVPVFDAGVALRPVMNVAAAMQQLAEFQEFVRQYLVPDEDYGTIPGTPKPTLYKSGAEKLCDIYGIADDYLKTKDVENWDANPPLFNYEFKCILTSRRDQKFLGAGFGSCSSYESKYKWRESKRKCPLCQQESIIKGKEEYGGGWLCWAKKGGCGAKFLETDKAIVDQKIGREANEDIADIQNTILKMAKKRAKIDAVIAVTRSSGIFTQDMEEHVEIAEATKDSGTRAAAQRVADEKIAEAKKKAPPKASNNGASLFYALQPSGLYAVTGDVELMRRIYKQFKAQLNEDKDGKFYMLNDDQLNVLQFECKEGNIPLSQLKGPKA